MQQQNLIFPIGQHPGVFLFKNISDAVVRHKLLLLLRTGHRYAVPVKEHGDRRLFQVQLPQPVQQLFRRPAGSLGRFPGRLQPGPAGESFGAAEIRNTGKDCKNSSQQHDQQFPWFHQAGDQHKNTDAQHQCAVKPASLCSPLLVGPFRRIAAVLIDAVRNRPHARQDAPAVGLHQPVQRADRFRFQFRTVVAAELKYKLHTRLQQKAAPSK